MSKENEMMKNDTSIKLVQNIIDYIEENIMELLSPEKLAKHFFLSVSTLNILFKTACNITIMEYVRNRRLSLAGMELFTTNILIIDLAYKYGYETPEAFTKAFTRFHGFPPSFVRRTYPKLKFFHPFIIKLEIHGGWEDTAKHNFLTPTKSNSYEQEISSSNCYDKANQNKGGFSMENRGAAYQVRLKEMKEKESWRVLLLLARKLEAEGIKFKVDGKTMIFAHGLEFKLDKICLTFKWKEEDLVKKFFHYKDNAKISFNGFKYFDVMYEEMLIRCMYYGDCPGDDTDEFLYQNADLVDVDGQLIYVQSLEFYYENAEPNNEYYKLVEEWIKNKN